MIIWSGVKIYTFVERFIVSNTAEIYVLVHRLLWRVCLSTQPDIVVYRPPKKHNTTYAYVICCLGCFRLVYYAIAFARVAAKEVLNMCRMTDFKKQ